MKIPNITNGGINSKFSIYRTGSENGAFPLMYSTIGRAEDSSGVINRSFERYQFAFGLKSKASDLPNTGTVRYTGIVQGRAVSTNNMPIYAAGSEYSITGTVYADIDFQGNLVNGAIKMMATDVLSETPRTIDLGTTTFSQATLSRSGVTVEGAIENGTFKGFFAGPLSPEFTGTFVFQRVDPSHADWTMTLVASLATKRASTP